MRLKNITKSILLASSLWSGAFISHAATVSTYTVSPSQAAGTALSRNSGCGVDGNGDTNCQPAIATNTSSATILLEAIQNLLKSGLGDGDDSFVSNGSNQTQTSSAYLSIGKFINNLLMPTIEQGSNGSTQVFALINNNRTDFERGINRQQKEALQELLQNRQVEQANNGADPIQGLDVRPYAFPESNQVLRNALSSVSPNQLLAYMQEKGDKPQLPGNNQCANASAFVGSSSDTSTGICLQPYQQLNTISGADLTLTTNATSVANTQTSSPIDINMPDYWQFLAGTTDNVVLPSLSLDSLLSPLSYTASEERDVSASNARLGLYGLNSAAAAGNYIRYLSGELLPNKLASNAQYSIYKSVAEDPQTCLTNRIDAVLKMQTYRALLRTYAAQLSVGVSNLYHLRNKRRPIRPGSTSQLEEEFKMATQRIFTPDRHGELDPSQKTAWQKDLEKAGSLAVQRQMAQLLAEINYQMYLNRREQERILTTLSAMQLGQNSQMKKQLTLDEAASFISDRQINAGMKGKKSCAASLPTQ